MAQQTRMQRTDAFKITLNTANQEQLLKQKYTQGISKKLNPNQKYCYHSAVFCWRLRIMVVFQLVSCQLAQPGVSIGESQGLLPEHECWETKGYFPGRVCLSLPQQLSGAWWVPHISLGTGLKYVYIHILQLLLSHKKNNPWARTTFRLAPTQISSFLQ